jgi:hypothetical protein
LGESQKLQKENVFYYVLSWVLMAKRDYFSLAEYAEIAKEPNWVYSGALFLFLNLIN